MQHTIIIPQNVHYFRRNFGHFFKTHLNSEKKREPAEAVSPFSFLQIIRRTVEAFSLVILYLDVLYAFYILELGLIELARILADVGKDTAVDVNNLAVDEIGSR